MSERERFCPLDDQPLGSKQADQVSASVRLDPLKNLITNSLDAWLWQRPGAAEAPRIGLFGGLGQGKSTVLELCLEELEERREKRATIKCLHRVHDAFFGPPIARFDVSHFKADDLEWRFLTAVLWQRIQDTSIFCLLPLLILLVSFILLGLSSEGFPITATSALGVVGGVSLIATTLRLFNSATRAHQTLSPAAGLYVARRDWIAHTLARLTGTLPRVVIVDDLDRAKVEQQRAFLRAILRFSRQMKFAVVVCMDEAAILASKPDPEAPEELLRKTIQLELHLPDRNREDLVFLVINICNAAADSNPSWKALLRHPQWIADYVRCLLLLGPLGHLSPRMVKHLLNAVCVRIEQLELQGIDDCCAVLRLESLLYLAPELRRHTGRLLAALELNRRDAFEVCLNACAISHEAQASALRFFSRSRAMQPEMGDGWFRILGGIQDKTRATTQGSATASPLEPPGKLAGRSLELLRLMSASIEHLGRGYAAKTKLYPTGSNELRFDIPGGHYTSFTRTELPTQLGRDNCAEAALFWPLWISALSGDDAHFRDRIYLSASAWIEDLQLQDSPRHLLTDLLRRERLADSEVWALLPEQERTRLLQPNSHGAPKLRSHRLMLTDLLEDDGGKAMASFIQLDTRDFRRAALWLSCLPPGAPDEALSQGELSVLVPIWPSQLAEDCRHSWFETLRAHAGHELRVGSDTYQLPDRLAASWAAWGARHLDTGQCLDILFEVATRAGNEWSLRRLAAWLVVDNPGKLPCRMTAYPTALEQLKSASGDAETLAWEDLADDEMAQRRRLTAIAVAAHCGWRLGAGLVAGLKEIPADTRRGLLDALFAQHINNNHANWVKWSDRSCLVALLADVLQSDGEEDNKRRERWQARITRDRDDAVEVFSELGWTVLIPDFNALD